MKNREIREAAKERGIRLWQIAEQLGMTDASFSRKLRHEFSDENRENTLQIIRELAAEKQEG